MNKSLFRIKSHIVPAQMFSPFNSDHFTELNKTLMKGAKCFIWIINCQPRKKTSHRRTRGALPLPKDVIEIGFSELLGDVTCEIPRTSSISQDHRQTALVRTPSGKRISQLTNVGHIESFRWHHLRTYGLWLLLAPIKDWKTTRSWYFQSVWECCQFNR